jgi:hypothetical protein
VQPALLSTAGIDLEDDKIIAKTLGPILRYNKKTIDFFLNTCVFPKDAKDFPSKMSTSGWDIAMRKTHLTTGFSGTNDSRFLLPTSISQLDSNAQLQTSASVLGLLLQKEPQTLVKVHKNNLSSDEILKDVMALKPRPKVFLDVGAQILDCSNQDFASKWLALYANDSSIKAAIFFDIADNLCTIAKDGRPQLLLDSPYINRLEECLVYLDDVHTRGTDLKLPPCTAAVTLGPRLTKDKLVQG